MKKSQIKIIFAIFVLTLLSGCSISLAADITPPPNLVQPAPILTQAPSSSTVVLPMVEPDIQNGKSIFSQKCVACHGETGMGDGPQSGQLPNPVTPLGDLFIANNAKPIDWYRVVTIGNFEKFMPGFQSLSDRERWDVTAYALTLSLSKENIELGEQIFNQNCVECHTEENFPLQNASAMAEKSLSDIMAVISEGIGSEMPGFSDVIDGDQQLAVASYVRYLGFEANEGNSEIQAGGSEQDDNSSETPPAVINISSFSIVGKLSNLENLSNGLTISLTAYDGMELAFQLDSPVDGDGSYQFVDLEYVDGRIYQASVVIDGIQHTSDVLHDLTLDDNGIVELPIEIKKTSTDASSLYAERMHVFFDFIAENTIQVVEMYVIQNPTDSVIVPKDDQTPLVKFKLPEGAQNLQFENGLLGREFIQLEDGFGVMQAFGANASVQVLYAFELPYEKSLDLEIELPFLVNASIFMIPANTAKFSSEQLSFSGERDIQGMKIQTYSGGVMNANESISMNLSGKIKDEVSVVQNSNSTSLIIGGSVFLLAILLAIFYFRSKLKTQVAELDESIDDDVESLMDAVIALDDAFKSGEIPEKAYKNRRNELINQIKNLKKSEE